MALEFFPGSPSLWDGLMAGITLGLAIVWVRLIASLAQRDQIEQTLSRKIIHIGTGPLFVLCWLGFSDSPGARYFAALVPLALTLQFAAIGLQLIDDPAAVKAMTRTGTPAEILRGPLYYGLVFIGCTVLFWRHSPVGLLALMMLCGGDGLADVVGRRLGQQKLPWHDQKSWAGSAAMALGSFGFGFGFLALFNGLGQFQPVLELGPTFERVALIAAIATIVEAWPLPDLDNLTLTFVAIGLGIWLFG